MTTNDTRLQLLDDAIALAQRDIDRNRLAITELKISVQAQQTRLRELGEERRVLKAHVDRVRATVRAVA